MLLIESDYFKELGGNTKFLEPKDSPIKLRRESTSMCPARFWAFQPSLSIATKTVYEIIDLIDCIIVEMNL